MGKVVLMLCVGLFALHALADDRKGPEVLKFTMKSLEGQDVDLSKYSGRVVLIVNTASKCGYTPQYKALQTLHERYGSKGLSVLGFPSNDFGNQEPGSDADIAAFCQKNFGVTFDMFAKVSVKGAGKAPLFEFLTNEKTSPEFPGEIKWNFEKFLISKDGRIVARFRSGVSPTGDEMIRAIENELEK
jgi:glutathione peroxidase